jgi:AbrB family looped-hinge helix DNA binding protein
MTISPFGTSVRMKVGPKGQIVIPKAFRDRLGILPGSTVVVDLRPDEGIATIAYAGDGTIAGDLDGFRRFTALAGMEGRTASDLLHELDREEDETWTRRFGA